MHPLAAYLAEIRQVRATGANQPETSFYPALSNLFNELGGKMKPRVQCVVGLAKGAAGMPDVGLFTQEQFQKRGEAQPLPGQKPARGVVEAKPPKHNIDKLAQSTQVLGYWKVHQLVLVTNYRQFLLLGLNDGKPLELESYCLAVSEQAFWRLCEHPQKATDEQGQRFVEFMQRAMLHAAPLADPKDVAWFLASYARDARERVEQAALPALTAVRSSLEDALGLKFEGEKGEHFFRSTLVQTLFYGLFAAWVLWRKSAKAGEPFDWRLAHWHLHVPMISALYGQLAQPARLKPLGLEEPLDWAAQALNRVVPEEFFRRFQEEHAVQYFYEPFLEAFDPELRRELGVWYTPEEIVRYMVARVDTVLRDELGIADGLADKNVYVLDPCCGTGAYLVETLRVIHARLAARGEAALAPAEVKRAMMERIFGFEILPAPFVVAHLQMGLLSSRLGAPLGEGERAGVYLTNALTGWEPLTDAKRGIMAQLRVQQPELAAERDAAEEVKRDKPILVILGNPPYNGYAGVAIGEERELSDAYRTTKRAPAPQGQGLNELYVRFFRMAERKIVEHTGRGVVCYISNYSWLDGLSHTGMRERYLEAFDRIWIDNLNGDKYRTGKLTPEGEPDPSVFSTAQNREGIQVGTAITLLLKTPSPLGAGGEGNAGGEGERLRFRNLWGKSKHAQLLTDSEKEPAALQATYAWLDPAAALGFPFAPSRTSAAYLSWPLLPDLFPVSFPGVKTSRDDALVAIDREALLKRMRKYFDPTIADEEIKRIAPSLMENAAGFAASKTRDELRKRGLIEENFVHYCYRPFDVRWLYWEPETKLLDRNRSEYFPQVFNGNLALIAQQKPRRDWSSPQIARAIGCLDLMDRGASCFPLYLKHATMQSAPGDPEPNLSPNAANYLAAMDAKAEDLFHHAVAVLHSRAYREENAGALRQDWPRVPLPGEPRQLSLSAALGRRVASLLDPEAAVPGVTIGNVAEPFRSIAVVNRVDGKPIDPGAGHLAVTAGWGHGGKNGVTMPGKGRAEARTGSPHPGPLPEGEGDSVVLRGRIYDIYLNNETYWHNIPEAVWEYTIGGYQVIKKWLSYRERDLLGRDLTLDEVRYVTEMARRIAAILLLAREMDANYCAVVGSTRVWP